MPNGSFEEYSECPQGNDLNDGQFERAVGWWRPTMGTPDYFHRCNNDLGGTVGVPNNFWGHQVPFHGDGYVGLGPIAKNMEGIHVGSEYIRCELLNTLKPNISYHFSMQLSLAGLSVMSVGRLGVHFSSENQFVNTWLSLEDTPQIVHFGEPFVDTVNWMKFEGVFTAVGCEKYLTIGYFGDDIVDDTTILNTPLFGHYAYYYIDSVGLFELENNSDLTCESPLSFSIPNVFTPNSDGTNDFINIESYTFFIKELHILNRWGNIVAVLNELNSKWDGKDCPDGVYFYIIYFREEKKKQTGFIHLIR